MFEKALAGNRRYRVWLASLLALSIIGLLGWIREQQVGLGMTGLTRDVPWGLYIAQFVFCVGLGASALVVVLPYYLHDWKAFGRIAILGEILGMVSVFMAMLFIFVSMGQPMRLANVILYPHPNSLIFWDIFVLSGYVLINAVITVTLLSAERDEVPPPRWTRNLVLLSLPWAVAIHTVTAFLLSGLAARPYWMTALMAPRFLASAFTSGPALLILILLLLRRLRVFDAGAEAVRRLAVIVTYCMAVNIFFVLVEIFTAFYSQVPDERAPFHYLFAGMDGNGLYVPWTWLSTLLAVATLVLLLVPGWRSNPRLLAVACASAFFSIWIEKGLALMVGGFVPTPLGVMARYQATFPEWTVVLGIWAFGVLLITLLYKITLTVRREVDRTWSQCA
ncbi:MAG: sulfate reduction electron transfer complex DsrMKJOP subunit DsrP [Acidobacteriota bacterium]